MPETRPPVILLVDDSALSRKVVSSKLRQNGWVVVGACGGAEALEIARVEEVDLVLLDVLMPDIDGLEVLRRLRSERSPIELPVIMMTAQGDSEHVVRALELGANDHLTKPLDFQVALARVDTQLRLQEADRARRVSEERYVLAGRGANDGLWDWDLRTDEVYFSNRWKAMLGFDPDELEGRIEAWWDRVHPQDLDRLRADVASHLEGIALHFENECRIRHKDGSYRWMHVRGIALRDPAGTAHRMAGSLTDITERKAIDALTGLPNRIQFISRLERATQHRARAEAGEVALLLLDLDHFKDVNDSLGHRVGDELLIACAKRLLALVPPTWTLARFGGDELVVLATELEDPGRATALAERIQADLREPLAVDGRELFVTTSIGVTFASVSGDDPDELLRDADTALNRAKARGRDRIEVFHAPMRLSIREQHQVEMGLHQAISRGELRLHYQPKCEMSEGRIVGMEALLRWESARLGSIEPSRFIPLAERSELIVTLTDWVLREACRATKRWRAAGHDLVVSVNLSGRQLGRDGLGEWLDAILAEEGLEASALELELTETVLMDQADETVAVLDGLAGRGLRLAIDDFGTGYSSLSYLKRFPLHTLKIDRAFVGRVDEDAADRSITGAVVALAHGLGLEVVAEGVETPGAARALRALECDQIQGHLVSTALPEERFEALLSAWAGLSCLDGS